MERKGFPLMIFMGQSMEKNVLEMVRKYEESLPIIREEMADKDTEQRRRDFLLGACNTMNEMLYHLNFILRVEEDKRKREVEDK